MKREFHAKSSAKTPYAKPACRGSFVCLVCGRPVAPLDTGGAHRNHCPHCLASRHLDILPGDRAASCGGIMEPVAVWVKKNGEWALIHRCKICGTLSANRIAADDDPLKLLSFAVRPLACPPFPLERLGDLVNGR